MGNGKCLWRGGALLALAGALALGCVDIKEHVTIRSDGSGTVTMEVRTDADPEMANMLRMQASRGGELPAYPPLTEEDAKSLFPGEGFTVTTKELDGPKAPISINVAFKDVNDLLASPYGRAHSLSLKRRDGRLEFAAVSGLGGLVAMAGAKGDAGRMLPPPMVELTKKAGKMRAEFSVTMPGSASSASGEAGGSTVTWVMNRPDYPDNEAACKAFRRAMRASCADGRVTFKPKTPVRLDLVPFDEMEAGKVGDTGEAIDEEKVAAAARFVPYRLKTVRYFDLTGEGHGGWGQGAQLTGVVEVPRDLAPQKWGEAKLEEATDDRGASLLPKGDRRRFGGSGFSGNQFGRGKKKPDDKVRHTVTLGFKVPDVGVETIRRIKGSIDLSYYSGYELVKVKDAVRKDAIQDPQKAMRGMRSDPSDRKVKSADLDRLGIEMQISHAMFNSGMTNLSVQLEEKGSTVSRVQVFDADGGPLQSVFMRQGGGGRSSYVQIMVPGKPKGPLSFAVLAGGSATKVRVPITLSDVSVRGEADDE